jgi:hypothetical protein
MESYVSTLIKNMNKSLLNCVSRVFYDATFTLLIHITPYSSY